jgi:hypothetical protein
MHLTTTVAWWRKRYSPPQNDHDAVRSGSTSALS